jgi:hypothetical protein
LLDTFEEQLDLPMLFVDVGNGLCLQLAVVGEEGVLLVGLGINVDHFPHIGQLLLSETQ